MCPWLSDESDRTWQIDVAGKRLRDVLVSPTFLWLVGTDGERCWLLRYRVHTP